MHILYIEHKPVIICKETSPAGRDYPLLSFSKIHNPEPEFLSGLLKSLKDETVNGYLITSDAPEKVWAHLLKKFNHWQAAGGLVTNSAGEILLLFRRGKWDLPKGKSEENETPEETALREVSEETGLKNIHIVRKLTETWHSYPLSVYKDRVIREKGETGKDVLKQTFWFHMTFTGNELTIPQIEEDIMDIQWVRPENIEKYLAYSYPNLKQVFKAAGFIK